LYFGEKQSSQNTHGQPNEPDIYASEVYHKGVIGIYRTQVQPSDHDFVAPSSQ